MYLIDAEYVFTVILSEKLVFYFVAVIVLSTLIMSNPFSYFNSGMVNDWEIIVVDPLSIV